MKNRRALVGALLAASGCASSPKASVVHEPVKPSKPAAVAPRPAEAAADTGWLERLRERSAWVAPGMREVSHGESHSAPLEDLVVRAEGADACARVTYVASASVNAQLRDDAGVVLAERNGHDRGELGERGPVCIRRGGAIRVHIDGACGVGCFVRWVGWSSP